MGVKESDTGLARPDMWDLMADKVSFRHYPDFLQHVTSILTVYPTWNVHCLCSNDKENILFKSPVARRSSRPDQPRLAQVEPSPPKMQLLLL